MEILRGAVSHCQQTLNVSGGRRNQSTTTTYIALFRVENRAVELQTASPINLADGDEVVVAGRNTRSNAVRAYACRNVATGEIEGTSILGSVLGLLFVPIVILLMGTFAGGMFGGKTFLMGLAVAAVAFLALLWQVVLVIQARQAVKA